MSATIINIIIQLIAGAVGGNAAGAGLKNYDLEHVPPELNSVGFPGRSG